MGEVKQDIMTMTQDEAFRYGIHIGYNDGWIDKGKDVDRLKDAAIRLLENPPCIDADCCEVGIDNTKAQDNLLKVLKEDWGI